MKASLLPEPELQFGNNGRHLDIRFGICNYSPLLYGDSLAPLEIRVGLIGTPQTIQGVKDWLEICRAGVPGRCRRNRTYSLRSQVSVKNPASGRILSWLRS